MSSASNSSPPSGGASKANLRLAHPDREAQKPYRWAARSLSRFEKWGLVKEAEPGENPPRPSPHSPAPPASET